MKKTILLTIIALTTLISHGTETEEIQTWKSGPILPYFEQYFESPELFKTEYQKDGSNIYLYRRSNGEIPKFDIDFNGINWSFSLVPLRTETEATNEKVQLQLLHNDSGDFLNIGATPAKETTITSSDFHSHNVVYLKISAMTTTNYVANYSVCALVDNNVSGEYLPFESGLKDYFLDINKTAQEIGYKFINSHSNNGSLRIHSLEVGFIPDPTSVPEPPTLTVDGVAVTDEGDRETVIAPGTELTLNAGSDDITVYYLIATGNEAVMTADASPETFERDGATYTLYDGRTLPATAGTSVKYFSRKGIVNSPVHTVTFSTATSILLPTGNDESPAQYYDLTGRPVPDPTLSQGIYIRRQGTTATKVAVR